MRSSWTRTQTGASKSSWCASLLLFLFFLPFFFFSLLPTEAPEGSCHAARRDLRCQKKGRPPPRTASSQPPRSSSSLLLLLLLMLPLGVSVAASTPSAAASASVATTERCSAADCGDGLPDFPRKKSGNLECRRLVVVLLLVVGGVWECVWREGGRGSGGVSSALSPWSFRPLSRGWSKRLKRTISL